MKALNTKLQMLEFTNVSVREALERRRVTSMERKIKVLQDKIGEIQELETKIQEAKIENGEDTGNIREWSNKIESDISKYEASVAELNALIKDIQRNESEQLKREEEDLASKLRHQKFEEEMKFEEAKLQQKLSYEKKSLEGSKNEEKDAKLHTKLPKLIITKFKGAQTDWVRFWGQFQTGIDGTNIPPVTKLSYLKEFLDPKVRVCIDGLPFTTDGYERAKNHFKVEIWEGKRSY